MARTAFLFAAEILRSNIFIFRKFYLRSVFMLFKKLPVRSLISQQLKEKIILNMKSTSF